MNAIITLLRAPVRTCIAAAVLLGVMSVRAEPVKLPAGMRVVLELQHHVNSA